MANGPITWSSGKQSVVATEAEYVAVALGIKETLLLKSFIIELGFPQECNELKRY